MFDLVKYILLLFHSTRFPVLFISHSNTATRAPTITSAYQEEDIYRSVGCKGIVAFRERSCEKEKTPNLSKMLEVETCMWQEDGEPNRNHDHYGPAHKGVKVGRKACSVQEDFTY